jgi:hypothetical protein
MRRVVPCFCLVRLTGATQIPRFKRKNQIGYVEYWNAGCGESRMSGVDAGKERKLLPMHTRPRGPTYRYTYGSTIPVFIADSRTPSIIAVNVFFVNPSTNSGLLESM